jgi:uroporphyrinogen-III decarboxylase
MSYADGWAAMNLEKPARIPRTEYSADFHWDLVRAVTGLDVRPDSPPETQCQATIAFMKAWNYDMRWAILTYNDIFKGLNTRMGHAVYAAEGVDFDEVRTATFSSVEEVLAFDPMTAIGPCDQRAQTRAYEEHYRALCAQYPDGVNMTGIYVTCVSGLLELFGWDQLLMALGSDPEGFGAVADRYAAWIQGWFDALAAADVPVVMVHDDIVWSSGPFYDPAWYRRFVLSHYHKYFAPLIESGKKILFTSDGDYTMFLDDIAEAGVHGLVMEPLTDMRLAAERYGQKLVLVGNADTRILLEGSRDAIRAEVKRCIDIGRDCPGFFMAVGNHIPPNTPVESALFYNEVYEELCMR